MKTFKRLFVITALTLSSTYAQVQSTGNWSSEFLGRINDSIGAEWEDAGQKLSASIFESITDQEFFKTKVVGDVEASLKVQRKVYDNHDILDSWTVVDIMRAPVTLPIPLLSDDMNIAGGAFGLRLAMSFTGVAYNIRQVLPKNIDSLISTNQINAKLDEAREIGDQIVELNNPDSNVDIQDLTDGDDTLSEGVTDFAFWSSNNPRTRARYSKLWNILTHPLSIPLTEKSFHRYQTGSIASYGVEGAIQLGASVGWDQISFAGIDEVSAGLGVSTYVKGNYRISILKEDSDHAQVKLTRVFNKGAAFTVGRAELEHEIFEGFVVLGQDILRIKEEIIPFSLVFNKDRAKQFDVGYRYDFNNPQAVKAYEKAVLGRFAESEKLSQIEGTGVEKKFTREQIRRSYSNQNKIKLSLIFESATSSTQATTQAVITLGDEKHHLFSSENIQYKAYDTLWGNAEKKQHNFITSVLLDNPDEFIPERVSLRIEGRIDDTNTTANELRKYYSEVETALQKEELFPRPPAFNVEISCDELQEHMVYSYVMNQCQDDSVDENGNEKKEERADYGEVSFYYQLDLNYKALEIIRETDKDKMWETLEKAYDVNTGNWSSGWRRCLRLLINSPITLINIPLYLANLNIPQGGKLISAIKFYRAWKKLRKVKDSKEFVTSFGKLFRTVHFSGKIVKAVRILTATEKVPYFFTAKSERLWGQMSSAGESFGQAIPLYQQADEIINFDQVGPRSNGDKRAIVEKVNLKKISRTQIKISFTLSEAPEYLYFRIDRTPSWGRYKNLMKVMIRNQGEFKKGDNEFVVDIEKDEGFLKKVAENLFNEKYSTFLMGYSIEKQNFGPINSTRFEFDYQEDEDKDNAEVISNVVIGPQ